MPLNHCVKCGVTPRDGLQNCSRCHGATGVYCSKECQVAHWKVHKPICRVLSPYDVCGIKILDNHAPWNNQFHHVILNNSHPIFTRGELCPLTEQCGFPLIIFSQAHNGMIPATQDNQPAVYLRIEPDNGLAPMHWQSNDAGTCYVVRADRKPLTKEAIEIIYKYHAKLLNSAHFEEPPQRRGRHPSPVWLREFAGEYRKEQIAQGREGFDFFPPFP